MADPFVLLAETAINTPPQLPVVGGNYPTGYSLGDETAALAVLYATKVGRYWVRRHYDHLEELRRDEVLSD